MAFEDNLFLRSEDNRGLRLMLEYDKPEKELQRQKIQSTIVAFGSARVFSPEQVSVLEKAAESDSDFKMLALKKSQLKWYEMAREFGAIVSKEGGALNPDKDGFYHNVIATGGGPGLMEATNRGASEVGAKSIGFNIYLPFEKEPNPYSSKDLTFRFYYFAIRKMHLTLRTKGLAVFPGGFGTLDEIMELLNLITTGKNEMIPIVLFDKEFWNEVINIPALVKHGMVSESALGMIEYADTAQEGWEKMKKAGLKVY